MRKILLAALIGAVLQFIWGFLFWGFMPLGKSAVSEIPNQSEIMEFLDGKFEKSGVYYFPMREAGQSEADYMEDHKIGPLGTIFFHKGGEDMMAPGTFINGFIHFFISTVLMGLLLAMAMPGAEKFSSRYGFVLLAGVFALYFELFVYPIWWYHSSGYYIITGIFDLVCWLLAGIPLAALIKPSTKS